MKRILRSLLGWGLLFLSYTGHTQQVNYAWTLPYTSQVGNYISTRDFAFHPDGGWVVGGDFIGTHDFDPGADTFNVTATHSHNVYVQMIDENRDLEWIIQMGSDSYTGLNTVATDPSGNVYIGGTFSDTIDVDPSANVEWLIPAANWDAFVVKYDKHGNYLWGFSLGDYSTDQVFDIEFTSDTTMIVAGAFIGTVDFDPGAGVQSVAGNGNFDGFLLAMDTNAAFQWVKTFGSSQHEVIQDIYIDKDDDIYLTGSYRGTVDLDPGPGVDMHVNNGQNDAYVARYDASGNYIWGRSMGSNDYDGGYGVVADDSGNVYFTGELRGTIDLDPTSGTQMYNTSGYYDLFVEKLDSNGALVWAKGIGGTSDDYGRSIALDDSGNVYLAGSFRNTVDFDPTGAGFTLSSNGGNADGFLLKMTPQGAVLMGHNLGWTGTDNMHTIAIDDQFSIYSSGSFEGNVDFDPGPGTDYYQGSTISSGYLRKLNQCMAASYHSILAQSCDAYLSPSGNHTWTTSGVYTDTLINAEGCDSILTIDLTIHHYTTAFLHPIECSQYTSPSGNHTWTSSGMYTDTLVNVVGCDSIITIDLTILGTGPITTLDPESCHSYTSPSGKVWTASGVYMDTLSASTGCDSIFEIDLTIDALDPVTLMNNGSVLSTDVQGDAYQWVDCSDSTDIVGAISSDFAPTISGVYTVRVTNGTCTAMAECETFIISYIKSLASTTMEVYPNPFSDQIVLKTSQPLQDVQLTITTLSGQQVWQDEYEQLSEEVLQLSLAPGVYILSLTSDSMTIHQKMVRK